MISNSMRRRGRFQWRVVVGLSVLCFLIIASASHAGNRLPVTGGVMQVEGSAGGGLTSGRSSLGSAQTDRLAPVRSARP